MPSRWVPTAAAREQERQLRLAEMRFLNSPLALWDKVLTGGKHAQYLAQPLKHEESSMSKRQALAEAARAHAQRGRELEGAARRWLPDPANPTKSLDGHDLDAHPPEHRARKLKEAQRAIESHDEAGVRELNPLIDAAEFEPRNKVQLGTRLTAADTGEVTLLVQQYRDLTKEQKQELATLGRAALTRGDLTAALQYKRAAEVLHVNTPEFDTELVAADPVRREGGAELGKVGKLVEAMQAEQARTHVRAGMARGAEEISHIDWAAQHGVDPEGGASYVEAALSGE